MGYALGTKRTLGWFYIHLGGKSTDETQKVVLCKSPIDALSYAMLQFQKLGGMPARRTMYLAADSIRSLPLEFLRDIPEVIAAYGNSNVGNQMARDIKELLPQAKLTQPTGFDWNQQLLSLRQLELLQEKAKQKKSKGLER